MSKLLDNVVVELSRLPGMGRRTALRLAMHILRMDKEDVVSMGESLIDFRTKICRCAKCNNLSDTVNLVFDCVNHNKYLQIKNI